MDYLFYEVALKRFDQLFGQSPNTISEIELLTDYCMKYMFCQVIYMKRRLDTVTICYTGCLSVC